MAIHSVGNKKQQSYKALTWNYGSTLKEDIPITENCYISPLCNKPRDPFSRKNDVTYWQKQIVQSPNQDYVICLSREREFFYEIQMLILNLTKI